MHASVRPEARILKLAAFVFMNRVVPTDADYPASWDERPVDFARVNCGPVQWCESAAQETGCDYKVASAAIDRLEAHAALSQHAAEKKPLFLGVGFRDDHLKVRSRDLHGCMHMHAGVT